jgi:hypothetical protein
MTFVYYKDAITPKIDFVVKNRVHATGKDLNQNINSSYRTPLISVLQLLAALVIV